MRVLWFEVTVPQNYCKHSYHGAGWQDALESIVKTSNEIELGVAFETIDSNDKKKSVYGVQYFPIHAHYNLIERIRGKSNWEISRNKLIPLSLEVIEEFKPDIIHVFGSEWCYGQVAEYTEIPVVIHLQGSIPPINNAFYPPGYNKWDECLFNITRFKLKELISLMLTLKKRETWKEQEEKTLRLVNNYMGRTKWDKSIVQLYNRKANYFYCSEALRATFIDNAIKWKPTGNSVLRLTTVGCSSLWKGIDTIVRTAKMLKERNISFEWCIAGNLYPKDLVEWKEKTTMEIINIRLMGMLDADKLQELLLNTDIYVHTAYIDNSSNSVCEAQYIGLPIIATNVGGIPSLIANGIEGILVPANDPYTLSSEIIQLSKDIDRQVQFSHNTYKRAIQRHNPSVILNDLVSIYVSIAN